MPIIRADHSSRYTCISQEVTKAGHLTPESRGVLCWMLSLPDSFNFSLEFIAHQNGIGRDKARRIIDELIGKNHIHRSRTRVNGRLGDPLYVIYELPDINDVSKQGSPKSENRTYVSNPTLLACDIDHSTTLDYQKLDKAESRLTTEKPTLVNKTVSNNIKKESTGSTSCNIYPSYPVYNSSGSEAQLPNYADAIDKALIQKTAPANVSSSLHRERMSFSEANELVFSNINFGDLQIISENEQDLDCLRSLTNLMLESLTTYKPKLRVAGEWADTKLVQSRLSKINTSMLLYVMMCIRTNTTQIRNHKAFCLTCLFNAPLSFPDQSGPMWDKLRHLAPDKSRDWQGAVGRLYDEYNQYRNSYGAVCSA